MIIDMSYRYKGSSRRSINLVENSYGIDLLTEYGERIATITTGYSLMRVLEDLYDEKYR